MFSVFVLAINFWTFRWKSCNSGSWL